MRLDRCILVTTRNYGSILQMFVVGYSDTLTMSVPLQVLRSLSADFDGKRDYYYYNSNIKYLIYIAVTKAFELLEVYNAYRATK